LHVVDSSERQLAQLVRDLPIDGSALTDPSRLTATDPQSDGRNLVDLAEPSSQRTTEADPLHTTGAVQQTRLPSVFRSREILRGMIMRGFVIGALAVAVAVLGYLYWDSQHNTIVKVPGVEIKKN
jgi:hypothetical protein